MLQKVCIRGEEPYLLYSTVPGIRTVRRIFRYSQSCQPKLNKSPLKSPDFGVTTP
jgi:hypothetical protein